MNLFFSRPIKVVFAAIMMCFSVNILAQDWIYTVVEGDNLWNLSEQHLDKVTRFEQVRKINGITDPLHLKPGTKIRIPLKWIRSNPVPAIIVSIDGSAELQGADNSGSQPLHIGTLINLGDQIRTADNSTVAIQFADKSILTLHENSLVHFDHLTAHGVTGMVDSRLNLLQGRMDTKVTPAKGPGSRFEIQTPSAISAVRGTVYRASVSENGKASNIEVLRGKVAVSGANKQQIVSAGYGTHVATGKAPLPPRSLLVAPKFEPIPNPIEQLNWRLSWSAIKGASSYRVELASDLKFDSLLWEQVSTHTHIALPDFPDGQYSVRVRAIDALGIEGLNQDTQIIFNVHPQAPVALQPIDGQVLRGQTPTLQWTGAEEATSYRLEIATDSDFTRIVHDKMNLIDTRYEPTTLFENKQYYWRLSSIASDGELGPVGPTRSYQIKPIPEKVDANVSAEDDGQLVASWRSASNEQHYQVQISDNKTFNTVLIDQRVDKATFAFSPIEDTTRYLRVKSIEDDGYEGPWGSTQTIAPLPAEEVSYWPMVVGAIFTIVVF